MRAITFTLFWISAFATASCSQEVAPPQSLRVLSSNGPRAPIEALQTEIETAIGYALDIEFSTSASLTNRIETSEPFDVTILTPALIERLVAGGHVETAPVQVFARSGVGIGAAQSEIERDVSTVETMRTTLLAAESVTLTADGQSRRVSEAAFEALGITEEMQPRIMLVGPGQGPHVVVRGEAELVLTLVSEIVPVDGLSLIGPFPDELQDYVSFAAGISTKSREADAARRLLEQLNSPTMIRALETHGMEAFGL